MGIPRNCPYLFRHSALIAHELSVILIGRLTQITTGLIYGSAQFDNKVDTKTFYYGTHTRIQKNQSWGS